MTDINFYVSENEGLKHRLAILYKLVNLALQRNLSIHIHTDNEVSSQQVDDYLWSTDPTSFIPHSIIKVGDLNKDSRNLVNISHNYEPFTDCEYLINLSAERPNYFSRFLKVAEILDSSEEILTAGRKRYAFYRDRGYTLNYYQL